MANRYRIVPDSVNVYYFDGSDSAPSDSGSDWSNLTNADDGGTGTYASTTAGDSSILSMGGTNAPGSGGTITQVRFRWSGGVSGMAYAVVNVEYSSSYLGGHVEPFTGFGHTSSWTTLSAPSGGWTWAKVQALTMKASTSSIGPPSYEMRLAKGEIEVTTATVGGDWGDTDYWSTSSGGAGGASVPTSSDNVFIDSNSGVDGLTITYDDGDECDNFTDSSGDNYILYASSFRGNLEVNGDITIDSDVSMGNSGRLVATGSSDVDIDMADSDIKLDVDGTGRKSLVSNLPGGVDWNGTGGVFDANGYDVGTINSPVPHTAYPGSGHTYTVYMGEGTWYMGTELDWVESGGTFNVYPETSTVHPNASYCDIRVEGNQLHNLTWGEECDSLTIITDLTVNNFEEIDTDNYHSLVIYNGITLEVGGTFTMGGSDGNPTYIQSNSGTGIISVSSGALDFDYLSIENTTATGGAYFYAGDNSVDNGGNSGWIFASLPTTTVSDVVMTSAMTSATTTSPSRRKKVYRYKVFSRSGSYIKNWDREILNDISFAEEINTAGYQVVLSLGRNLDVLGEELDLQFGNIVKVYLDDKETKDELIFQGRIVNYKPVYKENESLEVTLFSLGYELDAMIYRTSESPEQSSKTGSSEIAIGPDSTIAQSFIPDQPSLTTVLLKMRAEIATTDVTLEIQTDSSNEPSGTAVSGAVSTKQITNPSADELVFNFDGVITLTPATKYWLVLEAE